MARPKADLDKARRFIEEFENQHEGKVNHSTLHHDEDELDLDSRERFTEWECLIQGGRFTLLTILRESTPQITLRQALELNHNACQNRTVPVPFLMRKDERRPFITDKSYELTSSQGYW